MTLHFYMHVQKRHVLSMTTDNILYNCAILIFQIIEKIESALDNRVRENNEESGDKRPVGKKQRGRWNQ